ncbi:HAMP domain-containing protein [Ruania alkalisoli]|uniref:Signal transduction histidine-protein kinase/phosphatase MprB n=2 Tax=Ruania alkalisoli TaxID=2779775 RepID=A0A7M1T1L7_9MICO|nr:ATP-binding protein [Ruania alkalisoli]QOR72793.1 HAMP domain-containing protein [Ruania alkalisoli]
MRRRVLTVAMAAVTVAVIFLGLPMGIFGALKEQESIRQNLQVRTESVTRSVEGRIGLNAPVDQDYLDRWVDEDSGTPARITIEMPNGEVVIAGPDVGPSDETFAASSTSPSGALVVLEVSGSLLFWRGAQVVFLVTGLSVLAFAGAAMVALRLARRLAAPLIYLAASAEQIGSGQVRPRLEPSGVEEIDLVAAELARTSDRLAGRIAAERQFAANVSHQLRTPLTALSMRLEEIQLLSEDEEVREEARISLEQVERLVHVVDDLLKASRKADGGTTEALHLDEVFDQQRDEWVPSYTRVGRTLEFGDARDTSVLATPGALAQVLATLLENSLKYGEGTTSVRVRPSKSGVDTGVVIEVADEGPGVADDLAPRIFERHVTSGKGTGLGLGLARDLVTADGGRLELAQRRPPVFAIFLNAVPKRLDPDKVLPPGSLVVVGRRRRRR